MATQTIECRFSLLNEGRKYSGNHRKYVIENAQEICYSDPTKEKIRLREAFGYYGHGRRILSGKMDLGEVDVITLPDGTKAMVSNIPSNLTTKFDVASDGTVTHTQEILNTETGKIVSSLHGSRVGGFSWACPGTDGGRKTASKLTGFAGFDYVLNPGFSANRGYVLESAQGDMLLESVAAVVGDDKKAEQLVAGWKMGELSRIPELEEAVFESEDRYFRIAGEKTDLQQKLTEAVMESARLKDDLEKTKSTLEGTIRLLAEDLPFFIPEDVQHAMLEGDFKRAHVLFESAKHLDYTSLPLSGARFNPEKISLAQRALEKPEQGTAEYGFSLDL
ncbi:MAG: hypothetical protein IJU76_14135 [Desulfovibrionaceae bacterium]|nr:hypothetical protein [Desulfovibrionaceae bacterium]